MTSTSTRSIRYAEATLKRAERAVRCSPFQVQLFTQMRGQSVALRAVVGKAGVDQGYTRQPLAELRAENALLWLIQVGVLRREVDGQGLTDRFRLAPLGHQLVEQWSAADNSPPAASLGDRLYNALSRWVPAG